jgi:broad specificity phosphatase PhoE
VSLTVVGVRHGEVHNPTGVIYAGLEGYGLSELGSSQAAATAEAFRDAGVVALYSSPLDRAMQTAGAISDVTGLEIRPDDRLYEWKHWQQWAGMTWDELRTKGREAFEAYQRDPGSVTSGESLAALGDRMDSWLADVRRDHAGGVVVGVSHLEPLRAILLRLLGRPMSDLFQLNVGLGSAVRLAPIPDPISLDADALRAVLSGPRA